MGFNSGFKGLNYIQRRHNFSPSQTLAS